MSQLGVKLSLAGTQNPPGFAFFTFGSCSGHFQIPQVHTRTIFEPKTKAPSWMDRAVHITLQ